MGQAFSLVLGHCEAALTGILFIVYACHYGPFKETSLACFHFQGLLLHDLGLTPDNTHHSLHQCLIKHSSAIVFSRFADPPSCMTSEFDAFPEPPLKQKYLIPEMV